jgi:hypothetical protein
MELDVRFGSLADICSANAMSAFPESGHLRALVHVRFVPIADIAGLRAPPARAQKNAVLKSRNVDIVNPKIGPSNAASTA